MNQGRLGSCVGCAGAGIMQYYDNLKTGKQDSDLSELDLYWECEQIDGHPGQGTYPKCAMQVLKNRGIPEEKYWPYCDAWPITTNRNFDIDGDLRLLQITRYYRIKTHEQLLKAIAAEGPVLVTLKIFDYWYKVKSNGWIEIKKGFPLGLHALNFCGYDIRKQHYIVHNSWGWMWGDCGFCYIPFEYFKKYKQDCWVPVIDG